MAHEHEALAAAITRAGGLASRRYGEDIEAALVEFVQRRRARSHRGDRGDHAEHPADDTAGTTRVVGADIVADQP